MIPPDPWSRLRHLTATGQVDLPGEPLLVESESNDVWRIGAFVLRVCWRGDPGRLERELLVATHLPEGVPYPPVVAGGRDEALSWTVTRRLPGSALSGLWDTLAPGERRAAIRRHAQILQTLHAWQPPPAVSEAIRRRPPADPGDPASIVGADVNPLPLSRARLLVEAARRLPFVDPGVLDAIADRFQELRASDPFLTDDPVVVHGDAGTANLLWHQGKVVALLDFEWVRWGPRDLELTPFVGFPGGRSTVLAWLEEDYPRLFAAPDLVQRLWLYQVAGTLRGLIVYPPRGPENALRPYGAVEELRKLLGGAAHIEELLGR
jgi:aminoglycoside phosphotransferase (APT) family kinase protein